MNRSRGRIATASADKYIIQLCKHFGHRLEVEHGDGRGVIRFPSGPASMEAAPDALFVTLEAPDAETLEKMHGIFARHLDRFAFREAPLNYEWEALA